MFDQRPVLIMAGGTGGHIYPALAVAELLREQNVPVVWMGTKKGLESKIVPENNIPIEWLKISAVRGKGTLTWLLAPLKIVLACIQAMKILRKVKPRCVLGMGGFVAGPGGLMANLLGIPLVIHEQNAIPGLTNNKLANRADVVLEAFPDSFLPAVDAKWVGNPVRKNILDISGPEERLKIKGQPLRLLIVGGSLGAKVLNDIVPEALSKIAIELRPLVRHQSGEQHHRSTIVAYKNLQIEAQVDAYIDDISVALGWADLVICRAGAMTVSELAVVGLPAIFIPYPYAVDDHQTANAHFLSSKNGAVTIQQNQLDATQLANLVTDLSENREKLLMMSQSAKVVGKPDAAKLVTSMVLQYGDAHVT